MRKDLQKRVYVVAAAIEKLAGPEEIKDIENLIHKISLNLQNGSIPKDKLPKAHNALAQLWAKHNQLEQAAGGDAGLADVTSAQVKQADLASEDDVFLSNTAHSCEKLAWAVRNAMKVVNARLGAEGRDLLSGLSKLAELSEAASAQLEKIVKYT